MSLGNWEGKICNEAKPEELPKMKARGFCDRQKGHELG